ncbi:MAG: hypothetical protein R2809_06660 [Flavobacteriales bacterium]
MKKRLLIVLFAAAAFCSCSSEEDPNSNKNVRIISETDSLFVVQKGPFHFSMSIPKDLIAQSIPMIIYQESTGKLVISVGDKFFIEGSQEIKEIEKIKSELLDDNVLISKVEDITKSTLLYSQSLPHGKVFSWHYKAMKREMEMPYFFESSETHQFTLEDVRLMQKAIDSISPL